MLKFRRSFSPEKSYNSRGWIQIHNYKRTILRKHFTQNFSFDDQIYFSYNSPALASAWPGCAAHWSLHGTVGGIYYFCFVEKYLCIKIFVTSADFKLQKWFSHQNGVEWSAMVICTGHWSLVVLRLWWCAMVRAGAGRDRDWHHRIITPVPSPHHRRPRGCCCPAAAHGAAAEHAAARWRAEAMRWRGEPLIC